MSNPARPVVCHLLHTLHVGGAEVLATRLARGLRDDFRFVFACLDELGTLGEELRDEGFPMHVLGRKPGLDVSCMFRLAQILKRERVELIHAHQYTPFFYALAARRIGRKRPVLFTEHGRHFPDLPRRKRIWFNRLFLGKRDRVVGVGEAVRQALIRNEGFPAERVEVVYNGIDPAPLAQGSACRHEVRESLRIGPADFVVLQVARLDYLKDHATAVRAMARVVRTRPEARLLLAGEGPEGSSIREAVQQAGVAAHVDFLGLRKDVARLLAAADVFLLTSISEGIPLTVIEAMAAGLPVVGTRVGGVPEVVEEGKTGLLAPAGGDASLAEHLLCLAQDPNLRRELGERGRARAETMFSERRMHDRYSALYRETARQKAARV